MELKKEILQHNIKQEAENELYNVTYTPNIINEVLGIKFEDTTFVQNKIGEQVRDIYANISNIEQPSIIHNEVEDPVKNVHDSIKDIEESNLVPAYRIYYPPGADKNSTYIEKSHQQGEECEVISKKIISVKNVHEVMCRFCAGIVKKFSNAVHLYEDTELYQKVNYSLPISIIRGDGLSEYVCRNCRMNVILFYDFMCRVIKTDKTFRENLNSHETQVVIEKTTVVESIPVIEKTSIFKSTPTIEKPPVTESTSIEKNPVFRSNPIIENVNEVPVVIHHNSNGCLEGCTSEVIYNKSIANPVHNYLAKKFIDSNPSQTQPENTEKYDCRFCLQRFPSFLIFRDHFNETHRNKVFVSSDFVCEDEFTKGDSLPCHINSNYGGPTFCDECNKAFFNEHFLQKHKEHAHSSYKECEICGMTFKSALILENHKQLHNSSDYSCVYCYRNYETRLKLRRHTKKCHSGCFTLLMNGAKDELIPMLK